MYSKKVGKILPKIILDDIKRDIAAQATQALRTDYPNVKALARAVADQTDIDMETIKKWYNGRNTPNTAHLVILLRCSSSLFETFLHLSGHGYLIQYISPPLQRSHGTERKNDDDPKQNENVPINVPVKLESRHLNLNPRQRWFLSSLLHDNKMSAAAISKRWYVSKRTAKRDIARLRREGAIVRIGARKNGKYQIKNGTLDF